MTALATPSPSPAPAPSTSEPVSHRVKQGIIESLVKPAQLLARGAWPREVKLINQLLPDYPDPTFWLNLKLGFQLNSLAYLKTMNGADDLAHAWHVYTTSKAQAKQLDTLIKSQTLAFEPRGREEQVLLPLEPLPSKPTIPEWADAKNGL